MDKKDRERIKGIIINKFRGDKRLLEPGLEKIKDLTGVNVLGVIPWIRHNIDDEDSVTERFLNKDKKDNAVLDICVIRTPYISNFTDFSILENTEQVKLRYETVPENIQNPDLLIIPGSKSVINDLKSLKESGMYQKIRSYASAGGAVMGICGGLQILGKNISDPYQVESIHTSEDGIGLLNIETVFKKEKETHMVSAGIEPGNSPLLKGCNAMTITGYEIHMGETLKNKEAVVFSQRDSDQGYVNGIMDKTGRVLGTYIHGIFDNPEFVSMFLNNLAEAKQEERCFTPEMFEDIQNREIDKLATVFEESVDMKAIYSIMGF